MKLLLLLVLPFYLFAQTIERNHSGALKALAFVNSLTEAEKKTAVFPFDEMNRYEWHYLPAAMFPRTGIAVKDLDNNQKEKLNILLQAYLSQEGYAQTESIMNNEYLLKEMQPGSSIRIPEDYYVSIYGTPAKDSIWGWKFTGHHVSLNFTVVEGKLAFAPFFFGIYPAEVKEGPQKGRRILKDEEDLGFELINSMTSEQKLKTIFAPVAFTDLVSTNSKAVNPLEPAGISAAQMTHEQKTILNKLIVAYLLAMPSEIAKVRMEKISAEDFDAIGFGWAGETNPGEPHYYRIQGKSFLIEFDNTQNNANHIHAVWRDFNGDFGEDLLKEHYQHDHHH